MLRAFTAEVLAADHQYLLVAARRVLERLGVANGDDHHLGVLED